MLIYSSMRIYVKIAHISRWNDFCLIPLGNVFLGGEVQIDAKNWNFDIFESALCIKSGSMPLTKSVYFINLFLQGHNSKIAFVDRVNLCPSVVDKRLLGTSINAVIGNL